MACGHQEPNRLLAYRPWAYRLMGFQAFRHLGHWPLGLQAPWLALRGTKQRPPWAASLRLQVVRTLQRLLSDLLNLFFHDPEELTLASSRLPTHVP